MKIAIHGITTRSGSFPEHLAAYEKTGWKHFEINLWNAGTFIEENGVEATARLVADHGLTCVGATGLGLSTFGDDAARAANIEQVKRYGEAMQALGCRPLVIGSDGPAEKDRSNYSRHLDTLARHINAVAEAAQPFGVQLAVEVNWTALCRSFRTAADLVKRVRRDNVGLVWDPAHFFSTPSRLDDLELAQGKIIHAHTNDIRECFIEVMDINGDRVIPGQGVLPLREWSDQVTACGYDGYHCVELFSEELWAKDTETICREVMAGCKQVWPDATF
ncbi:MAG TPA: sugar phosphate isomerase/epimerase family protein [Abditibacteriaceae bacterium]|nr:sugar phosphate isomerase/epimerase family protein [Abditibacteriaceae bacterium]